MMISKIVISFIISTLLQIHLGYGEKLVILKGYSSENKVELFDFDNLKPSKLLADYPADENGEGQAWLLNDDSTILSCGGSYTHTHFKTCKNPNCYSYSIKENNWSELKKQPETQIDSGIYATIPNVGPIVLGGYLNGNVTESGCIFAPTTTSRILTKDNIWKNGPNTPNLFYHGCSANINDDTTYVNVNQQAFMVNWKTMHFKKVKAIKESHGLNNRVFMACVYDPDSKKVIIAGGDLFDSKGYEARPTNSVKLYDPSTDSYEDGPDLPYELVGAALSVVGKDIILSGGEIGIKQERTSDMHKYSEKSWIKLPVSMRQARSYHNVITLP